MEKTAKTQGAVDFVLLLGDNFYHEGVLSTRDSQWWTKFESVYDGPVLGRIPFFAALGNHDYLGNPQAQVDYSRIGSGRWHMDGFHYARDFGMTAGGRPLDRLVVLDTNCQSDCQAAQTALLDRSLAGGGRRGPVWKVVAGHHPARSIGLHSIRPHLRAWLPSVLKRFGADLYLAGHDHNQQVLQFPGEPLYVISGGGGQVLHPLGPRNGYVRFAAKRFGFAKIIATPVRLEVVLLDQRGGRLYATSLQRSGEPEAR